MACRVKDVPPGAGGLLQYRYNDRYAAYSLSPKIPECPESSECADKILETAVLLSRPLPDCINCGVCRRGFRRRIYLPNQIE